MLRKLSKETVLVLLATISFILGVRMGSDSSYKELEVQVKALVYNTNELSKDLDDILGMLKEGVNNESNR